MNNLISKNNRMIRWDITDKCNLSCKHCLTSHMYDDSKLMSKSQILKVINDLSMKGVTRVHLLGGESTILPDIDEIVSEMYTKGIAVSLNTNGVILSENLQLCKAFAERKVGISFSIDGANEYSNDMIRGKGSFKKVITAATNYASYAKEDKEIVIAFYITLTPDNKNDDYARLFKIASDIGINNIVLGVLIPMGAGKDNYDNSELSIEDILEKTEEFVEIGKGYPNIKISFPFQTPLLLEYLNENHNTNFGLCYSKCKAGVQEYSLQPDGTLFPCVYLNDRNKEFSSKRDDLKQSNNLLYNDIDSIVSNDFFTNIIEKLNNDELYAQVEPCNVCPYNTELDICRPCSFQHYENTGEDIDFHKNKICKLILARNNNRFYR